MLKLEMLRVCDSIVTNYFVMMLALPIYVLSDPTYISI